MSGNIAVSLHYHRVMVEVIFSGRAGLVFVLCFGVIRVLKSAFLALKQRKIIQANDMWSKFIAKCVTLQSLFTDRGRLTFQGQKGWRSALLDTVV